MNATRRHLLCTAMALAGGMLLPAFAARPARAADSVSSAEGTQLRLIAGSLTGDVVHAGLEIALASGWKTYWRYPGDSGVPPRFNWSGSTNVADVRVGWPAPRRFPDGAGGFSIGYKDKVVLPLAVRLTDKAKPAQLDLALDFAVCQSLCVPADAHLTLALPGAGGEDPQLAAARASVPVETAFGAPQGPAILGLTHDTGPKPGRLIITARATPEAMLFLEGPDDSWALPLPEPIGREGDIQRFAAPLLGVPTDTPLPGARLRLTLVEAGRAIETEAALPQPDAKP
ncbi:protein involved in C cytochrome biogenesis [Azorhizobium oxalatiphilum]|uniref:Protein involved in C cytochrome biogenesis n=1 Tax=Azorhizobium oxalatiphilum TaxID=980631 RepID=A0A917BJ18_9HYPH|nr:protein-disulfide reductase DsbD domain-containing protein [Azorhizobium oxalatiphilum]GGF44511.1 protein involved in C cytochrome biogenesis [Azorhizobium oxalatiphilum]